MVYDDGTTDVPVDIAPKVTPSHGSDSFCLGSDTVGSTAGINMVVAGVGYDMISIADETDALVDDGSG